MDPIGKRDPFVFGAANHLLSIVQEID